MPLFVLAGSGAFALTADIASRLKKCEHIFAQQRHIQTGGSERVQSVCEFGLYLDRHSFLRLARGLARRALRPQKRYLVSRVCALWNVHFPSSFYGRRFVLIVLKSVVRQIHPNKHTLFQLSCQYPLLNALGRLSSQAQCYTTNLVNY